MGSLTREERSFTSYDTYSTRVVSDPVDRGKLYQGRGYTAWKQVLEARYGRKVCLPYWENGGAVVVAPADSDSWFYELAAQKYYCRFRMTGSAAGTDISRKSIVQTLRSPLVLSIRYCVRNRDGGPENKERFSLRGDDFNFHEDYLFNYAEWHEQMTNYVNGRGGDFDINGPSPELEITGFLLDIVQGNGSGTPTYIPFFEMRRSGGSIIVTGALESNEPESLFKFIKQPAPTVAQVSS